VDGVRNRALFISGVVNVFNLCDCCGDLSWMTRRKETNSVYLPINNPKGEYSMSYELLLVTSTHDKLTFQNKKS